MKDFGQVLKRPGPDGRISHKRTGATTANTTILIPIAMIFSNPLNLVHFDFLRVAYDL